MILSESRSAPLSSWEKFGLVFVGLIVLVFGAIVLIRSAFQQQRKTDFGVYARAAYAVRAEKDLYDVYLCDDHGWHYCYPPPFAIFMLPFAEPFRYELKDTNWLFTFAEVVRADGSVHTGWYLRYEVSVAIWYLLSVAFLWFAVHILVKATLPDAVPYSRRWWYARTIPIYICIGGIGFTFSRGQVNTLLVFLLAGMFVAAARGRLISSGLWLASAISLKVIPAYMVLYPFVRREWRTGIGVAAGLFLLLGALPVAVWGVDGAFKNNMNTLNLILKPGTTGDGDQTRAKELTDATATDSQSFQAVIHNIRNPDRATRPTQPDKATRLAHWAISGVLTLITMHVGWRNYSNNPINQLVLFGSFCTMMLLVTPVSHTHYFVLVLPLVVGLWIQGLAARPGRAMADAKTTWILVVWGVITTVTLFPNPYSIWIRDMGPSVLATLGLWAFGLVRATRSPLIQSVRTIDPAPMTLAA